MEKRDLKICVYAICKNEEKFVNRWIEAMQGEADYVVVLDTGSTDSTVEKLKAYEPFVTVKQYDYFKESGIFRFDRARNDSMKLIPNDVDICAVFDLDQVPQKGWGNIIREEIANGNKEVRGYIVDHNDEGHEVNRWESRNVHVNDPFFIWTKVIHEGIEYYGKDKEYPIIFREDFVINHYPDNKKDRTLYRTLLEYATKEYPKDPYYAIYLGIELERRYSKEEAAKAFRRALSECNFANSKDIEYQICINLAMVTDSPNEALIVLDRAKDIGFKTRRIYKVYADIYETMGNQDKAIEMLEKALEVPSYSSDWTDDYYLYTGYIEDRLSLFYYYQKSDPLTSIEYCARALKQNPNDERINSNLKFYYEAYLGTKENK